MPGWNPKFREAYRHQWVLLRRKVLERDGWICQCHDCQSTGRIRPATDVDHIVPKAKGGTDDLDNLQALHRDCHRLKSIIDQGYNPRKRAVGLDGWPL